MLETGIFHPVPIASAPHFADVGQDDANAASDA